MNLRYLLLAGAMTASCALWPVVNPASAAPVSVAGQFVDISAAPDVGADGLVRVSSGENQGFWKNLFNRSDRNTDSKPVFMQGDNKPGRAKPYDFGANASRPDAAEYARRNLPPAADAIKEASEVLEREKRWAAAREKEFFETIKQRSAANRAAAEQGQGAGGGSGKKMVYDPAKARAYDPNAAAKGESQQKSRIYNTR